MHRNRKLRLQSDTVAIRQNRVVDVGARSGHYLSDNFDYVMSWDVCRMWYFGDFYTSGNMRH